MYRFIAILLLASVAIATAAADAPVEAVPTLDLPRYMGRWFEIAKFPNRFQTQCAGDTTATYALQSDGSVRVTNRCRTANGTFDQAVGRAERTKPADQAKLRVRFAPAWLGWLDLVWGDYWVIDLDPDYTLAAVSEPRREYLWILARDRTVDEARYQALLDRLRQQGFDTDKLVMTPQSDGDAQK